MASGKSRPDRRTRTGSTATDKLEWDGFVACTITADMEADLDKYVQSFTESDVLAYIEAVATNCKLSFSANTMGGGVLASLTVTRSHSRSQTGRCLTAYAPNARDALAVLAYKDTVILDEHWDESAPNNVINRPKRG